MIIPVKYQLFGPVQQTHYIVPILRWAVPIGGAHTQTNSKNQLVKIDEACSSGLVRFNFADMPKARKAEFHLVWKPQHEDDYVALYHCDTGPSNQVYFTWVNAKNLNAPNNQKVDITPYFDAFRQLKWDKQFLLAAMVKGKTITIYDAHLFVEWEV
jgi:hypothetical protein